MYFCSNICISPVSNRINSQTILGVFAGIINISKLNRRGTKKKTKIYSKELLIIFHTWRWWSICIESIALWFSIRLFMTHYAFKKNKNKEHFIFASFISDMRPIYVNFISQTDGSSLFFFSCLFFTHIHAYNERSRGKETRIDREKNE